jgi:hypothetical protein
MRPSFLCVPPSRSKSEVDTENDMRKLTLALDALCVESFATGQGG